MAAAVMKAGHSSASGTPRWVLPVKNLLWGFAWLTTAFYAFVWISMPDEKVGYKFSDKMYYAFEKNKQWGGAGQVLIPFSAPILVLAIVAYLALEFDKAYPNRRKASKQRNGWLRRVSDGLFTQPLLVRGPLGMMNGVELVGFAMVLFVVLWQFWKYTMDWFKVIDAGETGNTDPKYTDAMMKLEYISVMLGWVSMITIALLFLPVTRGSPILKLIDIPFEHAVKHHVWLGHLTLILVLAHGVGYGIFYSMMDEAYLFVKWQKTGISNLAGVIALIAGLFMWPTSLAWVRRRHFNLFFNVHQLYIIFFAFTVYHLGVRLTGYFLAGPFLFFIDRFLRFLQSRRSIRGVKARVLPTGIVELKLPVSPGNSYNPLSFMFVNLRGLAKLEWHPFCTASTPLDNTKYMSVLIKPLGDWTDNLRKAIEENKANLHSQVSSGGKCPISLKLFAEGPYGHESNYFLEYKHLLLVAGGIGVTPFMAIITDILYRHQSDEVGLPTTVDLIWCVKTRAELNAFKDQFCDPARIFTNYGSRDSEFRVNIKVSITAEKPGAELFVGMDEVSFELQEKGADNNGFIEIPTGDGNTVQTGPWRGVEEGGSGSNLMLFAGVTAAACLGLTLFLGLFRVYVYLPNSDIVEYTYELTNYYDVSLFLLTMAIAVIIFGGAVVYGAKLGSKFLSKSSAATDQSRELQMVQDKLHCADIEETGRLETLLDRSTIVIGSRPKLPEVMGEVRDLHDNFGGAEVGVLVCGPETLACTVAELCRSMNFRQLWTKNTTQFHYHSVSFDLGTIDWTAFCFHRALHSASL